VARHYGSSSPLPRLSPPCRRRHSPPILRNPLRRYQLLSTEPRLLSRSLNEWNSECAEPKSVDVLGHLRRLRWLKCRLRPARPALPFSPTHRTNFATAQGVPKPFVGTHKLYYLSRFAWVFYLLALLFAVTALATGVLALCTRFGAYLSSLNAFIALFWQTLAASLMTAWSVQARNVFLANNQTASLGRYAYGFTWGAVACFLFATILFCAAGSGRRSRRRSVRSSKEVSYA